MGVVLRDRVDQASRQRWHDRAVRGSYAWIGAPGIEAQGALFAVPAVVAAPDNDIDLFDVVLADIADDQDPCFGVEGHAEWVAEAVSPDLFDGAGQADERVVRGDAV